MAGVFEGECRDKMVALLIDFSWYMKFCLHYASVSCI